MKRQHNRCVKKNGNLRNTDSNNDRTLMFAENIKKKRSCLMCGKMFVSNGPYNRRCPKCNRAVELGKGGSLSMPHVYKVSHQNASEMIKLKDIAYSKSES